MFLAEEITSVKDPCGKECGIFEEHRRLEGLKHGEGWGREGLIQDGTGERQERLCF